MGWVLTMMPVGSISHLSVSWGLPAIYKKHLRRTVYILHLLFPPLDTTYTVPILLACSFLLPLPAC